MRRVRTVFTTAVALLVLGKMASAQVTLGNDSATVEKGFPCKVLTLARAGGGVTPLYPGATFGLVVFPLSAPSVTLVTLPDGGMQISCHGKIPLGSTDVTVIDLTTGKVVTDATLGTFEEDCAALEPITPDVCRGNGAAIITTQTTNGLLRCQIVPGVLTSDWIDVVTPSGQESVTCHSSG